MLDVDTEIGELRRTGRRDDEDASDWEVTQIIDYGIKLASRGENVDHLLEAMIEALPAAQQDLIRQRFSSELAKRKLKKLSEKFINPPREKVMRLFGFFSSIIKQQEHRRFNMLTKRVDVVREVKTHGRIILGLEAQMAADRGKNKDERGQKPPGKPRGRNRKSKMR